MKTVAELNQKIWYRFAKVFFGGIFLLSSIIAVAIVNEESKPRYTSDYLVTCRADYTNQKSYYAEKDLGLYISSFRLDAIYSSLTETQRQKLREACDITQAEADTVNQKATQYIEEQERLGRNQEEIQNYIDQNLRPYQISKTLRTDGSYANVVGYSLLVILSLLVLAEIFRRAFYYVVLGSIRPPLK